MSNDRNQAIGEFYQRFPYPPPREDVRPFGVSPPSDFGVIQQYVYAGPVPADRPFRVLVAGGGTGDAVVSLVHQARARAIDITIDYMDLSRASLAIAKGRADALGLDTARFVNAPIETLLEGSADRYDYVDLYGVINHVADQVEVLRAIRHALAPTGGVGIMAYGASGRSGIYQIQSALSILGIERDGGGVAQARALLARVPSDHPLKTNPINQDISTISDTEFADRYLNPRDRAFSVRDLVEICGAAGLRIQGFMPPILYDPRSLVRNPDLREHVETLHREERWHLAEMLVGTIFKHVFIAVPSTSPVEPEAVFDNPDSRLYSRGTDLVELTRTLKAHGGDAALSFSHDTRARKMGVRLNDLEMKVLDQLATGARMGDLQLLFPDSRESDVNAASNRVARLLHAILVADVY